MIYKFIFCILIILIASFSRAQNRLLNGNEKEHAVLRLDLRMGKPLQSGLYVNFTDVVMETPKKPTRPIEIHPLFKKLERYQVKTNKKGKSLKSLFGVSDGINFYFNARFYSEESYFIKIQHIGAYFYFEDIVIDRQKVSQEEIKFFSVPPPYERKEAFVIDMSNGKLRILNEELLAKILKPHKVLNDMYQDSRKDLIAKRTIIEKLNQKLSRIDRN